MDKHCVDAYGICGGAVNDRTPGGLFTNMVKL